MQLTIRNDTPREVELVGAEGQQLILAPLEQRQIKEDDFSGFDLSEARRAGIVSDWTEPPSEIVAKVLGILMLVGILVLIACGLVAGRDTPSWFSSRRTWQMTVWIIGAMVLLLITGLMIIKETNSFRRVLRFLAQMLSLIVILAIGLGLPAATVYFFGDGKNLLASASPQLFARLLQVSFIATASLLPVLLFFLFDRYQLNTLRNRLYRDLFRLDRGLKTRSEIDAKYGSQISEAYGPEDQGRGRLARGTRWPVLVCAFVVTIGWLAAFRPVGALDAAAIQNPLSPQHTTLTFGFLGAYFFGLQLIARRYSRGDLKPKAYGYITIRILTVAVLSWVIDVIFRSDSNVKLLSAFLIGILPDEFFTLIREKFRGRGPDRLVPESEKHPLTKLEGIDLYDRARLEQEGIVNVESFAHHELIRLVLETRIPVPQLVDWMDQAILYLHVVQEPNSTELPKLQYYGIRTTTDLLSCWAAAEKDGELEDFKKLLGGGDKPYRLKVIHDALGDDEWLDRILDWRDDSDRELLRVDAFPKSFEGKVNYANDLFAKSRYKDAIKMFDDAIQIRDDDPQVRADLARLFAKVPVDSLRSVDRSRENARRAFELGQSNLEVLTALIKINEDNGDLVEALRACDAAILAIGDPRGDKERQKALKELQKKQVELNKKIPAPQVAAAGP